MSTSEFWIGIFKPSIFNAYWCSTTSHWHTPFGLSSLALGSFLMCVLVSTLNTWGGSADLQGSPIELSIFSSVLYLLDSLWPWSGLNIIIFSTESTRFCAGSFPLCCYLISQGSCRVYVGFTSFVSVSQGSCSWLPSAQCFENSCLIRFVFSFLIVSGSRVILCLLLHLGQKWKYNVLIFKVSLRSGQSLYC